MAKLTSSARNHLPKSSYKKIVAKADRKLGEHKPSASTRHKKGMFE